MRRVLLFVLLLAVASVEGAPAPFPKTPRPSAERQWEIDLGPLANVPKDCEYDLLFTVSSIPSMGHTLTYIKICTDKGRVALASLNIHCESANKFGGRTIDSLIGLTVPEALKKVLFHEISDSSGVSHGTVIGVRHLGGGPVLSVTVTPEGLDKRFLPTIQHARMPRRVS